MPISQETVESYRSLILSDQKKARWELTQLARMDHTTFRELCHHLLNDTSLSVRDTIFFLLGHFASEPDQEIQAKALEALTVPELQEGAAFVLGRIASALAFPPLFEYAQAGSPYALHVLWRRVTTEEDKQAVLRLARGHLISPVYRLREEALSALLKYSSAAAEENVLLSAARCYYDELVIGALSEATAKAIPALEELLGTVPPGSTEYYELSSALERLRKRSSAPEQYDRGEKEA
jgi:hypothetical protein